MGATKQKQQVQTKASKKVSENHWSMRRSTPIDRSKRVAYGCVNPEKASGYIVRQTRSRKEPVSYSETFFATVAKNGEEMEYKDEIKSSNILEKRGTALKDVTNKTNKSSKKTKATEPEKTRRQRKRSAKNSEKKVEEKMEEEETELDLSSKIQAEIKKLGGKLTADTLAKVSRKYGNGQLPLPLHQFAAMMSSTNKKFKNTDLYEFFQGMEFTPVMLAADEMEEIKKSVKFNEVVIVASGDVLLVAKMTEESTDFNTWIVDDEEKKVKGPFKVSRILKGLVEDDQAEE